MSGQLLVCLDCGGGGAMEGPVEWGIESMDWLVSNKLLLCFLKCMWLFSVV